MYYINNKYYLKQLLWLLIEEKNFYSNYDNPEDANNYYINNIYHLMMLLEK